MTLQQFITKYSGKKLDWDNAYGGQCVDLFRFYVDEVLGLKQPRGVVGAADFWANHSTDPILRDNFTKIANTPEFVPMPGDVMVWNKRAGGGFGHIAVVAPGTHDTNQFTSFDQNWRALNVSELTKHDYKNVYGVLRPVQSNSGSMQYKGLDLTNIDSMKVAVDVWADVRDGKYITSGVYQGVLTNLNAEKDRFKGLQSEYNEFIREIVAKLKPSGMLPDVTDRHYAMQLVEELVTSESDLRKSLKEKEDELVEKERAWKLENKELKSRVIQLEQEVNELLDDIKRLKDDVQEHNEDKEDINSIKAFIETIKRLIWRTK